MKPIALYPSAASHRKSLWFGAVTLFMGYQIAIWAPKAAGWVPVIAALSGIAMIGHTLWRKRNPKPSFEADEEGFSVMGRTPRPWSEFRGVTIRSVRFWGIPIAKRLSIKVGRSIVGGSIPINYTHLSSSATQMAAEIQAYGQHAKRKADIVEAMSDGPISPAAAKPITLPSEREIAAQAAAWRGEQIREEQAPKPVIRTGVRAGTLDQSAPVQSIPTVSERLFGRRKVI